MADPVPEQIKYFDGEFLDEKDFNGQQQYQILKLALHNQYVHTWGIAAGLQVSVSVTHPPASAEKTRTRKSRAAVPPGVATELKVEAGLAIDSAGNEIYYDGLLPLNLAVPTLAGKYYLTIQFQTVSDDTKPKRILEVPLFKLRETNSQFDRSIELILATATVTAVGTFDQNVDFSDRQRAGIRAGSLDAGIVSISGRTPARALTGQARISGTSVTGTDTKFLSEAHVGDRVRAESEIRTVVEITSDTSLTVNAAWGKQQSGVTLFLIPAALRIDNIYGNTALVISEAGNIGIGGTADPNFALVVQGDVFAKNIASSSDSRLKEDVAIISDALAKIQALRGVSFRWKDADVSKRSQRKPHLGLIGQEVERIVPEIVQPDALGFRAINYSGLIGLLVEAVKEQSNIISELQRTVDKLYEKVQAIAPANSDSRG